MYGDRARPAIGFRAVAAAAVEVEPGNGRSVLRATHNAAGPEFVAIYQRR